MAEVEAFDIELAKTPRSEVKPHREDFNYDGSVSRFWTSILRVEMGPYKQMTAEDHRAGFGGLAPIAAWFDNSFRITQRGSTFYREIIGGLTTFFTIAYVLTITPTIFQMTGLHEKGGVFFSVALTSGVFTTLMGLVTNLPIVLGPSLGLNFFFAETARNCPKNHDGTILGVPCVSWGLTTLPWADALGAVFISGWFYAAITFTGFRGYLYDAIPKSLRAAIAVGTGFFITMHGLKLGHITRVSMTSEYVEDLYSVAKCLGDTCADNVNMPHQWYDVGIVNFNNVPAARIAVIGTVIAVGLELFKVRGAVIIGIWSATLIGIQYYLCHLMKNNNPGQSLTDDYFAGNRCVTDLTIWDGTPEKIEFLTKWSHNPAGKFSFKYVAYPFFWQTVWTFLFFELLDSYGAIEGVVSRMGLTDTHPTVSADRINRAMAVDSLAVWGGAIMGVPGMNSYIESNVGVDAGARTGFASLVTGSSLLLCLLFAYPFVYIIPECATTCALIMIGIYSLQEFKKIDTTCYINRFSAFFTIAFMGFTYSITNGICAGVLSYCWLQTVASLLKLAGINARAGTKVSWPHPFLLIMAGFMGARFRYLGQQ